MKNQLAEIKNGPRPKVCLFLRKSWNEWMNEWINLFKENGYIDISVHKEIKITFKMKKY